MNRSTQYRKLLPCLLTLVLLTACGGGGAQSFSGANSSPDTGKLPSASSSASLDSTAPSKPDSLIQVSALSSQVDIRWSAASDNLGVVAYKIYRNGTLISTLDANTLSYSDATTSPKVIYLYGVSAGDAAGNWSSPTLLSITTPAPMILGKATLKWLPPTERENGNSLSSSDIGGYELRYRNQAENTYHYRSLTKDQQQLEIDNLDGDYVFEIAVFDVEGLYSNFVSLTPH